jgi:hypothetical protein
MKLFQGCVCVIHRNRGEAFESRRMLRAQFSVGVVDHAGDFRLM